MTDSFMTCPQCGSTDQTWRDEVDIGVGVLHGPLHCNACHYVEPSAYDDDLDDFA